MADRFRLIRADRPHRWRPVRLCAIQRAQENGLSCICRLYDGQEGYYLMDDDHAIAYYGKNNRRQAQEALRRHSEVSPATSVCYCGEEGRLVPGYDKPICGRCQNAEAAAEAAREE